MEATSREGEAADIYAFKPAEYNFQQWNQN